MSEEFDIDELKTTLQESIKTTKEELKKIDEFEKEVPLDEEMESMRTKYSDFLSKLEKQLQDLNVNPGNC